MLTVRTAEKTKASTAKEPTTAQVRPAAAALQSDTQGSRNSFSPIIHFSFPSVPPLLPSLLSPSHLTSALHCLQKTDADFARFQDARFRMALMLSERGVLAEHQVSSRVRRARRRRQRQRGAQPSARAQRRARAALPAARSGDPPPLPLSPAFPRLDPARAQRIPRVRSAPTERAQGDLEELLADAKLGLRPKEEEEEELRSLVDATVQKLAPRSPQARRQQQQQQQKQTQTQTQQQKQQKQERKQQPAPRASPGSTPSARRGGGKRAAVAAAAEEEEEEEEVSAPSGPAPAAAGKKPRRAEGGGGGGNYSPKLM